MFRSCFTTLTVILVSDLIFLLPVFIVLKLDTAWKKKKKKKKKKLSQVAYISFYDEESLLKILGIGTRQYSGSEQDTTGDGNKAQLGMGTRHNWG